MITKEAILEYLRSIKPSHEKEGIVIHGIFGSFARDEASENSDIDVLIETTPRFVEDTHPHKAKLDSRLRGNDERKDDFLELKLTKCVISVNKFIGY
ncbi:MAG: nucleotidyltransferase domain-containing protein [Sulfuricurvum sp.]